MPFVKNQIQIQTVNLDSENVPGLGQVFALQYAFTSPRCHFALTRRHR